jgi:hypothetical protein
MLRILIKAGLGVALCCAAPAMAAPAAPAADPARIAAAERLLDAMHYDRQVDRTLEAVTAQIDRSIDTELKNGLTETLPPDVVNKIKGIAATHMQAVFKEHGPELKRGTALIYATHFTVSELRHLAELQSDPVLVKMQQELPQIAADNMALTQSVISQESDKVRDEVLAVVQEYLRTKGSQPTS